MNTAYPELTKTYEHKLLYDILRLLKNVKKLESFAAHLEHQFNYTTSLTDL